MNSDYYGDVQYNQPNPNLSHRLLMKNGSFTPKQKQSNLNGSILRNNSLGQSPSVGPLRNKRKSIFSLDSRDNYLASDNLEMKIKSTKHKNLDKLSFLSVMNRTPLSSAKNKNRSGSQAFKNQSSSINENDNDSALNMSFIKKNIGYIKDFSRISSFNQKDSGENTFSSRGRTSKSNQQSKEEINQLFQSLMDVYDKDSINRTIQKVNDPKERQKIIDRILKRREEIKNAQQIVSISRCAQLINRFIKKVKKDEDGNQNNQNNNVQNNGKQVLQQQIDSSDKLSSFNTNDNMTFTSMNQKYQQIQRVPTQNDMPASSDHDKTDIRSNNLDGQNTVPVSPRNNNEGPGVSNTRADIIAKGIALSFFSKNSESSLTKIMADRKRSSVKTDKEEFLAVQNQTKLASVDEENKTPLNNNLSVKRTAMRKDTARLSLITKDSYFKNQMPAHIKPGSTEAKLFQINLNSITEKSKLLVEKGQETQREKANELLKDFQKLNLASHFKSKSLNMTSFNNSEINTFNFQRVIQKKKAVSKISSLTKQQKEQMEALEKFLTYEEPQEILNELKSNVASYLLKQEDYSQQSDTLDIIMPGKQFKFNEISKIDRGAMEQLKEIEKKRKLQLATLTKNSIEGGSFHYHQYPLTSRTYKDSPMEEINQFASTRNIDEKQSFDTEEIQIKNINRDLQNISQSTINQYAFQTTQHSNSKQLSAQQTKPYFFDFNTHPNSNIDKHIKQQFEMKKNNYKPSPQVKEKSKATNLVELLSENKDKQKVKLNQQKNSSKSMDKSGNAMSLYSMSKTSHQQSRNNNCFHLNQFFSYKNQNKNNRDNSQQSKDDSKKIRFSKNAEDNDDLFHDTKELNNSLSFASYTEIKLDQLYRQTKKIKHQIENIDSSHNLAYKQSRNDQMINYQKLEQQRQKSLKDLTHTGKEIQDTYQRKFKK